MRIVPDPAEGLPQASVINFDNLHVVAKKRLGERLGDLGPDRTLEVKRALGYVLDGEELKML